MRKITKTLPELAISDVEWAWLAGLFEGEACFSIISGFPRLFIRMTDEDIVNRVANYFGTSVRKDIRPDPNHKDTYRTQVSKANYLHLIVLNIWKYLGDRRKEAILRWYDNWDDKGYNFERPTIVT